jgi:hypothetical protein
MSPVMIADALRGNHKLTKPQAAATSHSIAAKCREGP